MSRRVLSITLAIAAVACGILLSFTIQAGSILWIIISAILLAASFIGYFLCNRCPHCGRVIHLDYLGESHIYCYRCGELVDLDEKL